MAFRDSFAAAAQRDLDLVTQKLRENEKKELAGNPAASMSPPTTNLHPTTETPPRRRTFSREKGGDVTPNMSTPPSRFSRNPVPERINQTLSSQPARHATGSFKAQGIGEESAFSTTQKVSIEPSSVQKKPMNRPSNGLEIRLDRLIDVVADFKGFKKEETDRDKIKALTHPSLITEKYEQIYQQQVLPARNKVFQNIEESQKAHPDHIIFMHSKEGHSKLVSLSRERAGSNAAYEGCDVEVISSGRSPFQPPSILFATPQAEQVVIDDAAFESSEPERSHPPKL